VSAADELRVACAGARSGIDPGSAARRFGCARLLRASPAELARLGVPAPLAAELRRADAAVAAAWAEELRSLDIECLTASGPGYPPRLAELADPPVAVFAAGARRELLAGDGPSVAIVGSRRGAEAARRLAHDLAAAASSAGVTVVSGLALGVDAAAHEGALAGCGPTLAVLGTGPDVAYPRTNTRLFGRVREAGLLVSEYPPGTPPAPWRFPARNRLIAALADATLVVEAAERSGALITADMALELGRDVLAVPGWPGVSVARGTNALIKAGAGVVEDAADLLAWLGVDTPRRVAAPPTDDDPVLSELGRAPAYADELAERLGVRAGEVAAALARLELDGRLGRDVHGRCALTRAPSSSSSCPVPSPLLPPHGRAASACGRSHRRSRSGFRPSRSPDGRG
jgi:DNA processing protein